MRNSMVIETASLRLRPFTREDSNSLYKLTCQREIPDWKMSPEQLDDFLDFVISSYDSFNPDDVRILLAVEHKAD